MIALLDLLRQETGKMQAMDEFADTDDESDLVGAWVYQDDTVAAKGACDRSSNRSSSRYGSKGTAVSRRV